MRRRTRKFFRPYPFDTSNQTSAPYDPTNNHVYQFENLRGMIEHYQKVGGSAYTGFNNRSDHPKTIRLALDGDSSLVPLAESKLEKLTVQIESVIPEWQSDVMGPIVSVPSYLANVPTPFKRLHQNVSDVSPMRIFVGIVSSGIISDFQMQDRGLTIMALVMALQKVRPVEVILYSELEIDEADELITIKLESNPISLAHCVNALANVYVARHLTYGIGNASGFSGGWPNGYEYRKGTKKPSPAYSAWRGSVLGITEHDLLLESVYVTDEILIDPVKWINTHLALYGEQEREGN